MATLSKFFGPHNGKQRIFVGIFEVGSGKFGPFDDSNAAFDGTYSAFGQAGTFTLAIKLSDDPANASGKCEIKLNDKTDSKATYKVGGKKLTFTTKLNDAPVDVYVKQGGTQIDNVSGHNLWIGP